MYPVHNHPRVRRSACPPQEAAAQEVAQLLAHPGGIELQQLRRDVRELQDACALQHGWLQQARARPCGRAIPSVYYPQHDTPQ